MYIKKGYNPISALNHPPSWKGKHHSEDTKRKMSNIKHPSGKNHPWYGRHHTKEQKEKISGKNNYFYGIHMRGKDSPNYIDGRSPLADRIRKNEKYKEWRLMVLGKDKFTCQECRKRGVWLEVHHINPLMQIIKENNIDTLEKALICVDLWIITNGTTLCLECHYKYKRKKKQCLKTDTL